MSVLTQLHRTEFNSEIVFQPGHDVTFPTSLNIKEQVNLKVCEKYFVH